MPGSYIPVGMPEIGRAFEKDIVQSSYNGGPNNSQNPKMPLKNIMQA
jgi:hypothetical protein